MPPMPAVFIPHGGGPLPLLGEPGHAELIAFLRTFPHTIPKPIAIVVISAHWEESKVTITAADSPPLIYDYYGFPKESYQIEYPAPGAPALTHRISALLDANSIANQLDFKRGFDHGVFVPLKLMYPDADIPCVQVSLVDSLDPAVHIQLGEALATLRNEGVLIVGSGFSFHNLRAMMAARSPEVDDKNVAFEHWLLETCTAEGMQTDERMSRLVAWETAPHARYCHPREEHLLPLHVCFGAGGQTIGRVIFHKPILNKLTTGLIWN